MGETTRAACDLTNVAVLVPATSASAENIH